MALFGDEEELEAHLLECNAMRFGVGTAFAKDVVRSSDTTRLLIWIVR